MWAFPETIPALLEQRARVARGAAWLAFEESTWTLGEGAAEVDRYAVASGGSFRAMRRDLLRWQWELYAQGHTHRWNLVLHAFTNPLFQSGTIAALSGPFTSWAVVLGGAIAMVVAVALQGRGHKLEATAPVPFADPLDAVARIFVEQWITFPRFVLSGAFRRALRAATMP